MKKLLILLFSILISFNSYGDAHWSLLTNYGFDSNVPKITCDRLAKEVEGASLRGSNFKVSRVTNIIGISRTEFKLVCVGDMLLTNGKLGGKIRMTYENLDMRGCGATGPRLCRDPGLPPVFAGPITLTNYEKRIVDKQNKAIEEKKRIADAKKAEAKRKADAKKAEADAKKAEANRAKAKRAKGTIPFELQKLKDNLEKLQDLNLDFLAKQADRLIREIENNPDFLPSNDKSVMSRDEIIIKYKNSLININATIPARIKGEEKRIADAKKAEEKRIADAKKAEAKRIADAKKADAKKADAKKAEEKKKETIRVARINSKNNPGFRDLKPGMPFIDYTKKCGNINICYGIQNIKFFVRGEWKNGVRLVSELVLDMGPIASDGFFIDMINELIDSDSNIYLKMKKNFDSKYVLDYEYSERDRQLFNENEKSELLVVYSKGQVALRINRKERENSYSKDLWFYIEYRDANQGNRFLKRNKPVTATLDDF